MAISWTRPACYCPSKIQPGYSRIKPYFIAVEISWAKVYEADLCARGHATVMQQNKPIVTNEGVLWISNS
jgi:hypothetical protein